MLLKAFRIHDPGTVEEAARLHAQLGDNATFYAGGTELLLSMKQGLLHYEHLIDIKGIPELTGIVWDPDRQVIRIGATVTHAQLESSATLLERLPVLCALERQVANVRVRSTGTLGGNLCFGDPHSDPGTLLMALGATFHLAGSDHRRALPADDFFIGAYETAREPDELLTAIEVPWPGPRARAAYLRFQHLERPAVGTAVFLWENSDGTVAQARIAVGCVSPRAVRMTDCEELLVGKSAGEIRTAAAQVAAEQAARAVDPVADLNGSEAYKRHLTRVLTERTIMQAAEQLTGAGA